jgi:potassium-dependent mechanosensitive channel
MKLPFDRSIGFVRLALLVTGLALAATSLSAGFSRAQDPQAAPTSSAPEPAANAAPGATLPGNDALTVDTEAVLANARKSLETITAQTADADVEDFRLAEFKVQADDLATHVDETMVKTRQRLEQIQTRVTQLGEPPQEGQPPEALVVTEERKRLMTERNELNAVSAEAGQVVAAARSLSAKISFAWKFKKLQLLSAIFLSICAALLFLAGGYRLFGRMINRDLSAENPPYITRLSFAFWSLIVQTASLTAFLIATFFFLVSFNVLRSDVAPMIASFFGFVWLVFFVARLCGLLFAPEHPNWRLAHVSNRGGRWLYWLVLGMAVINGLDYVLSAIGEALNSPVVLTIVKSLVASVLVGLILIGMSFLRPELADSKDPEEAGRPWPRGVPLLMRAMGLGLIFAVLTGYVGLARFASTQIVLTGAMIVTMYIGLLSGKAVGKQGSFANTVVGRHFAERFKLGEVALDQIGLAAGLGIYAVALLFGVPLILLTWGFQIQDIQSAAYRLFTQISIGSINISLIGILGGVLLFLLGYLGTHWAQRWIDRNVMARSQVDAGVRNSVKTGIGYLGIGLAAVIGISAAGIDLSSLALVASALSVGIGFGLQNIVSNFVSGLILLVERPFKVGDHVVTGTTEGIVKRISVRATEIETFRKQSIIVPNSDLINAAVGNWTHRNRIQRSEVPVSVGYDSDPKRVIALLLELAHAVPEVLRNPEPHVEFLRFGASSLDFELRFHLADMNDGLTVRNNLRAEILKRFREEGIEMPYPHQDVNIRGTVLTRLEPSAPKAQEKASQTDKDGEGEGASPEPA